MARRSGTKSVAGEQEQADSPVPTSPEDKAALLNHRRKLELARKDVERRLEAAQAEPHREMLRRALAALDEEIASLG
jgi:hypothetical protein